MPTVRRTLLFLSVVSHNRRTHPGDTCKQTNSTQHCDMQRARGRRFAALVLKIASITTLVPISNTLHTYVYKISLFAMLMYCKHHLSPQYHPPHCGSADENKGRSSRPGLQLRTLNTKAVPFGRANRPPRKYQLANPAPFPRAGPLFFL